MFPKQNGKFLVRCVIDQHTSSKCNFLTNAALFMPLQNEKGPGWKPRKARHFLDSDNQTR